MATERLRVILEMVTADYKKGAKDAARATDGITKSGQAADGALSGFRKRLNNIGPAQAAGIVAVGGAIAVQAGKAIKALDDLGIEADNIRNKFAIVFGDGADDVADWADEVNERFGISQVAVQDLAANFADLLVPIGFTRDEATGLTQEALQLANALSEWSGGQIDVATSTDTIRKALLGEREGLKALNVSILQSDVNARVAANGQAGLTGELKAQAEAQATLQLITEKSADAIAAYENNTNKALIAQKGFNASLADGQQSLADFVNKEVDDFRGVLPVLAALLEDATDAVNGYNEASEDSEEPTTGLTVAILRSIPAVESLREALQPLANAYLESKFAQEQTADETTELGDKFAQQESQVRAAERATYDYGQNIASIKRDAPLAAAGIDDLTRAARAQADPIFAAFRAADRYLELQKDLPGASKRTTEETLELQEAFLDAAAAVAELEDGDLDRFLANAQDALGLTEDQVAELRRELENTFNRDYVLGIVSNFDGNTAARIAAEAAANGTPLRAFGGSVSPSASYIVGERGPELFRPSGSGRIEPISRAVAGGDTGVVINLNVTTEPGFSNQVVREMEQALSRYGRGVS